MYDFLKALRPYQKRSIRAIHPPPSPRSYYDLTANFNYPIRMHKLCQNFPRLKQLYIKEASSDVAPSMEELLKSRGITVSQIDYAEWGPYGRWNDQPPAPST